MSINKIALAMTLAATAASVAAEDYQIQPSLTGTVLSFEATATVSVSNDVATLVFEAHSQNESLPAAQSEVNQLMESAQKAIRDFSTIAKLQTGGYNTYQVNVATKDAKTKQLEWHAVQSLKVETEDVEGVAALVQLAQEAKLGLGRVSFGLTQGTQEKVNGELTEKVVREINKRAVDMAYALKLPLNAFRMDKIAFNPQNTARPAMLGAIRSAGLNSGSVALPSFESGESDVTMSAQVTLVITPDTPAE